MPIEVGPDGPPNAKIMLVGEAPGAEEERSGKPFQGASGMELNRMLQEAGITRSECFVTNCVRVRPPANDITQFFAQSKKEITNAHIKHLGRHCLPVIMDGLHTLAREIDLVRPSIIVALGGTPLWALTGKEGITKWRGSMLRTLVSSYKVIPTYHPAAVLRQWEWRSTLVHDLRRAARFRDGTDFPVPKWNFQIRPSFNDATIILTNLRHRLDCGERLQLSFDIETRRGHIACAGVSWTRFDAICIPFMCVERSSGFWGEAEEATLVDLLYRCLTHRNASVIGQNILYDSQYTWRHWHFVPRVTQDTMISQHAVFSDQPKSLAHLASLYCDYYVYWKDEGKNWDANLGEDQLWNYNCQDCVYTYEVADTLRSIVEKMELGPVHTAQQQMFWPVLKAMQLGIRVDTAKRSELTAEVQEEIAKREQFIYDTLGHDFNVNSHVQMKKLFYDDLKLPVQMTRAKKGVAGHATLNDEAMQRLADREPLIRPLVSAIADIRTLGIFLGNFLSAPLDTDGRMRCAYNIGGSASGASAPKTYRLSSSEYAFGSGTNLQNIPSEKSKSVAKAAARTGLSFLGDPYGFPNIRSMFIPDPGYIWFDGDLDRADLQVVAWEADDEMLKSALRMGADIHLMNAFVLQGKDPPPLEELVENHDRYRDHRGPRKALREFSKTFCHGTNYGGSARTMAANTGRTVHEVDRAQHIWFGAHPGIKQWHDRIKQQVTKYHFVQNTFGYQWRIFGRVDSIIPEAIAWIPQSTVSIVINKIWLAIYNQVPEVQVLAQVHDSLNGQFPKSMIQSTPHKIMEASRVVVPYPDPLVIPFNLKFSTTSWGQCEELSKLA